MVDCGHLESSSEVSSAGSGHQTRISGDDHRVRTSAEDVMTPLPQLREAMNAIAEEKGHFSLFAVVKRADSPWQWDLVVAAPWLKVGRLKALAELVRLLEQQLGKREVRRFGRIATLEPNSRETRAELAALNIDNTERRFHHTTLFGADVEEAVVLRAKPARAA